MSKDKKIIIGLIILLIATVSIAAVLFLKDKNDKTAVIVNTDQELQDVDTTNQLRVKINPQIVVKQDTMQNLYFENVNKDRYLQCKIRLEDSKKYIYESELISENEIIKADVIDESKLKKGNNNALAEIYAYDKNKEKTKQTNVKIVLVK